MADQIIEASLERLEQLAGQIHADERFERLNPIEEATVSIHDSWSQSWLGQHSRIYRRDFAQPQPGEQFSAEWGLIPGPGGTVGPWDEYTPEAIREELTNRAGSIEIDDLEEVAQAAREVYEDDFFTVTTRLNVLMQGSGPNEALEKLVADINEHTLKNVADYLERWRPKGQLFTRDLASLQRGVIAPVHLRLRAEVYAIQCPYKLAESLVRMTRRALSFFDNAEQAAPDVQMAEAEALGTRVFIGHGRSALWRELKDFLQDRLGLEYEEFNRVPVAGVHTIDRLRAMVDGARFAFIVMTGEDDMAAGEVQPRMNVVHEAGLFQGRLGFNRAIILLEEGCAEFSNIFGLTQIRFPEGRISACFEEVRAVLEREGVI